MNIGIDHGYYAIKTRHFSFPAGIAVYSHEPYTLQNTLEYGGKFFVCGTGRQPILRNKMENDNYYLLTLAAVAKEIKQRGEKAECSVNLAAGLPLAGFGREKKPFREYLLRSSQPVCFKFEGIPYKVTIEDVKLFPQGYSAIAIHPELIQNEPSVLLMDIGGWTVDLMRLDNGVPNASTCRSLELGMIRCILQCIQKVVGDKEDILKNLRDVQENIILFSGNQITPQSLEKQIDKLQQEMSALVKIIAQGGDSDFYAAKLRQLSEQKMGLTNQLQEIQKKKMANQAQEYQYQQALLYINNEENLNLTEFNDDFIRRIIEQVTVLSATQIRIRFVGGYEQDANLPLKK